MSAAAAKGPVGASTASALESQPNKSANDDKNASSLRDSSGTTPSGSDASASQQATPSPSMK
jgi:hypothetical protein